MFYKGFFVKKMSESLIPSFFVSDVSGFAQKTDEQIPSPEVDCRVLWIGIRKITLHFHTQKPIAFHD